MTCLKSVWCSIICKQTYNKHLGKVCPKLWLFSPLLSRRWAEKNMFKKGITVETLSFGKDLEGRECLEANRHSQVTHPEAQRVRNAAVEGCKGEEGWQCWHECVCKWRESEKRINPLNQLIIIAGCQLTKCTETVPCLANSKSREDLVEIGFTSRTVKQ